MREYGIMKHADACIGHKESPIFDGTPYDIGRKKSSRLRRVPPYDICRAIEMPEEVTEQIIKIDAAIRYEKAEGPMARLLTPDTWGEGLKELRKYLGEDEKGFRMLTCMLHCAGKTRQFYEEHGISGQIFTETMKCFSRFVKEHKESYGVYGFDREWWTVRQLSGRLFRIGELEYEIRKERGECVVDLHIPSDARLEKERVLLSIRQGRTFLKEKFPAYGDAKMQCHSWLLSPALEGLLSPGSNILGFQSLFDIEVFGEDQGEEYMIWVFKRKDIPLADLPEDTSLQRSMKSYLLSGGRMPDAGGYLKEI